MKRDTENDDIAWDVWDKESPKLTALDAEALECLLFTLTAEDFRAGPVIGLQTQIAACSAMIRQLIAYRRDAANVLKNIDSAIQSRGVEDKGD